jgi:hypothetical protein
MIRFLGLSVFSKLCVIKSTVGSIYFLSRNANCKLSDTRLSTHAIMWCHVLLIFLPITVNQFDKLVFLFLFFLFHFLNIVQPFHRMLQKPQPLHTMYGSATATVPLPHVPDSMRLIFTTRPLVKKGTLMTVSRG